MEPKQKRHPAVNVSWCESEFQRCKEQYCTENQKVRFTNQGKLEVIKQMARVNIDILVISELKWIGMDEFNSNDYCIYYHGQESLRRNVVALIINKRVWIAVLGCNLKNDRMIFVSLKGNLFKITVIQVCAPNTKAEEAAFEWFYEDLQNLLELNQKKIYFSLQGTEI